jgi:hypothetical protein
LIKELSNLHREVTERSIDAQWALRPFVSTDVFTLQQVEEIENAFKGILESINTYSERLSKLAY